jgi:hypothetical protein
MAFYDYKVFSLPNHENAASKKEEAKVGLSKQRKTHLAFVWAAASLIKTGLDVRTKSSDDLEFHSI